VLALCRRWDWKIELSNAERAQQARAQAAQSLRHAP